MTTRYNPNKNCWYEDIPQQKTLPTSKPGNFGVIVAMIVFLAVSLVVVNL